MKGSVTRVPQRSHIQVSMVLNMTLSTPFERPNSSHRSPRRAGYARRRRRTSKPSNPVHVTRMGEVNQSGTSRVSYRRCSCSFLKRKRRTQASSSSWSRQSFLPTNCSGGRRLAAASSSTHARRRRSSSSSRSPSSWAIRSRAVSWSSCSLTRRWRSSRTTKP